jgi:hypothetical protein
VIEECKAIVQRAERQGRVEFRLSTADAKLRAEHASLVIDTIHQMALAMGLVFFELMDYHTKEYIYIVETKKHRAKEDEELKQRIAEMKRLRPDPSNRPLKEIT